MSAPALVPNGTLAPQPNPAQSQSTAAPNPLTESQSQAQSSQTLNPTQQSPQATQELQQQRQQQQSQQDGVAPRPRDARTMELLLTAQGVHSYEARVPLFLLDFAYRHTNSILSDALHLAQDPNYLSKSSAAGSGDATVKASAVQAAIASRLSYSFRGGASAAGGGGASKDWMLEIARERNKVALPRINANEWGVRLPAEKFVLSGVNWGLKEVWAGPNGQEDSSSEYDNGENDENDEKMEDAMGTGAGQVAANSNGNTKDVEMEDPEEEGEEETFEDVFGRDTDGDAAMG